MSRICNTFSRNCPTFYLSWDIKPVSELYGQILYFQNTKQTKITMLEILLNAWDFLSARLPTRVTTYFQRSFWRRILKKLKVSLGWARGREGGEIPLLVSHKTNQHTWSAGNDCSWRTKLMTGPSFCLTYRKCLLQSGWWAKHTVPWRAISSGLTTLYLRFRDTKVKSSLCLTNYALRYENVRGSGCIDTNFVDLGTSWRWMVSFTLRFTPGKEPLVAFG
jgi:hypothetical protein